MDSVHLPFDKYMRLLRSIPNYQPLAVWDAEEDVVPVATGR